MTPLEDDLTAAMSRWTEADRPSAGLMAKAALAPRSARRRRAATTGAATVTALSVLGLGATALAASDARRATPSHLSAVQPAGSGTAGVAPISPAPAPAPAASALSSADQATLQATALHVTDLLRAEQPGHPLVLGLDLASSHLRDVQLSSGRSDGGSGRFGLEPGGLDVAKAMGTPGADTTESAMLLATSDRLDLAYERVTITAHSDGGDGETHVEMVLVRTAAGWRVDSITGDLNNGAAGSPSPGPVTSSDPLPTLHTDDRSVLVELGDRAAASFPAGPGGHDTHGNPVVVVSGADGAVVDVPDVKGQAADMKARGTLRLYVTPAGLVSAAARGW